MRLRGVEKDAQLVPGPRVRERFRIPPQRRAAMTLVITKRIVTIAGIAALIVGLPHPVRADPCPVGYSHPAKAKKFKSSLVQAFVSCGGDFGQVPNATTETGTVPSCYPADTFHENAGSPTDGWLWGPKSQGSISLKAGKNKVVHILNTAPEAVDLSIQVSMKDIRTSNGLADNFGYALIVVRATLIDREEPTMPMTIIDFPLTFKLYANNGVVDQKTSLTAILNDPGYNQPALPRCTSLELVAVQLKDPNGDPFAVMGMYLP
jgi:hypothetical protein